MLPQTVGIYYAFRLFFKLGMPAECPTLFATLRLDC
jgi:hypothetical protein